MLCRYVWLCALPAQDRRITSRDFDSRSALARAGAQASKACADDDLSASLQHINQASIAAHAAVFDPAMVPLLYFPDEHLYAVFAPFFVPVVLHVFSATARIISQWRAVRRQALVKS